MPPPHTNALSQRLTATHTHMRTKKGMSAIGLWAFSALRRAEHVVRARCLSRFFFARTTFFRLGKNEDLAVDLLVLSVFRLDDNLEAIVLLSVARSIDWVFSGDEQ